MRMRREMRRTRRWMSRRMCISVLVYLVLCVFSFPIYIVLNPQHFVSAICRYTGIFGSHHIHDCQTHYISTMNKRNYSIHITEYSG